MNPCDELRNKMLADLNNGLIITVDGKRMEIPYQDFLKHYCTALVPRMLFLSKYKEVPPIEAFPAEEKTEWKKFVNEIFPGTTPQFRLEAVKIIHTIGILSN